MKKKNNDFTLSSEKWKGGQRNWPCFCQSGFRFKDCHWLIKQGLPRKNDGISHKEDDVTNNSTNMDHHSG